MTAFDPSYSDQPQIEKKTSGLAISSLICSLICCLPITTILGILLGIGAFVSISGNPAKKGKGLAIAGILLGVIFTAGQGIIYPIVVKYFQTITELVNDGPKNALTAGFANDFSGMRDAFHGDGANAQDEEIQAFIDQLQTRYGSFVESHMNEQAMQQANPGFGQTSMVFPYILTFDNATIDAEAEIIFSDPVKGGFVNKIGFIKILDPDLGDLKFPGKLLLNNEDESEGETPGESDTPGDSDSADEPETPNESDSGD